MKRVEKKTLTPDEYIAGPLIHWCGDLHTTLKHLWSNITLRHPEFHQLSFKVDRHIEHLSNEVREFFKQRDVFVVVRNYTDPKVGDRSSMTLIKINTYNIAVRSKTKRVLDAGAVPARSTKRKLTRCTTCITE